MLCVSCAQDLNLDVKLGGLGPDLDNTERKAKEENLARVRALGQQIREENAIRIANAPPKREVPREPTKKERADQFAKSVPKPKVRPAAAREEKESDPEAAPEEVLVPQRIAGSSAVALVLKARSPERQRGFGTAMPTAAAGGSRTTNATSATAAPVGAAGARTISAAAAGGSGASSSQASRKQTPGTEDPADLAEQLKRQQAQRVQMDKLRKQMGV